MDFLPGTIVGGFFLCFGGAKGLGWVGHDLSLFWLGGWVIFYFYDRGYVLYRTVLGSCGRLRLQVARDVVPCTVLYFIDYYRVGWYRYV